jgi:para-aminobenzoate synthetase / 4-amino-4-deoxychorismate lyase
MEHARLVRTPLASRLTPSEALRALRADRRPFALVGAWAGGGAVLGSEPADVSACDPFATLDRLPAVSGNVLTVPIDRSLPVPDSAGAADPSSTAPPASAPAADLAAAAAGVFGGWFGWLGFGLGRRVENVPPPPARPMPLADASLAFYDHVLRLDAEGQWWFEALWTASRASALEARRALLARRLFGPAPAREPFSCGTFSPRPSPAGHAEAVRTCLDYIAAGDLYQANLTLRLEAPFAGDALDLFADAAERVQPRYGAYVGDAEAQVASLSPELFLERRGRSVRTAPIKGTAPRSDVEGPAQRALDGLVASAKDRAENVMILDLMRNDLGRVSEYGSVEVSAVARPEPHAGVWHLVSEVGGQLRVGVTDTDLLRATFPPGSVTGAPKVKALEVIATLESTGREVYTGAIGFASPVAGLELNVAIRTFEIARGRVWLGAGGGIVADSDPAAEYEECLVKAEPLIEAVGGRLSASTSRVNTRGVSLPPPTRAPRPDPARGVFTTMAIKSGKALSAAPHLRRLAASVRELYGVKLDQAALLAEVAATARTHRGPGRLRVEYVAAAGVSMHVRTVAATATFPREHVELELLVIPGGLGRHKWIDREIVEGPERVIVDLDGTALETSRGSLWIVEEDRIVTPPTDGRILPGVTRDYVLSFPTATVEEISYERLRTADAIFITSAVRGLQLATLSGAPATDSPTIEDVTHHLATTASLAPAGR